MKIYSRVYVYQIRFVLQYARNKPHLSLRNLLSADDWKNMWTNIESISQSVDRAIHDRVGAKTMETWEAMVYIKESNEEIERCQKATLAAVQVGCPLLTGASLPQMLKCMF